MTDAVAAAGCPPGRYTIGGVTCALGDDGRVTLDSGALPSRAAPSLATPLLAGSALTLPRAIANTVRWTGLPLDDVIPMASTIPAAYLGTTTAGTVLADWDAESADLRIRSVRSA